VVSALNRRAVTIYLWHNPAIAACFVVGDAVGAWRLGQVGYLAVALVLLLGPVLLLGWLEDVSRLRSWHGRGRATARDLHGVSRGDGKA
jgi:hypothetical protein